MARARKVGKGTAKRGSSMAPNTVGATKKNSKGRVGKAQGSTVDGGKASAKRPITKTGRNPKTTKMRAAKRSR